MPAAQLYGDNPFRILGLRTTVGDREIVACIAAGASQAGRDLNVIGPPEERYRRAELALRDPIVRLRAELFWIAGDHPDAPPALDLADDDQLDRALDALQRAAEDPRSDPASRVIAAHDLAVVAHAACIHHRWLGPEFVAAVDRWSSVFGDAAYWRRIVERARGLGITMDPIPALREYLAETLATAWIEAAADLLDDGQDDAALALVVAIRLSSLPRYAVDSAVREITLPLRAAVKSGANAVCALADLLDGLPESTPPGWIARHLTTAADQLRQEVGVPLARLRRIAPGADDPVIADTMAQASARLASAAIGRLGDWDGGLALAGEAVVLARSGTVRSELATLQNQVRHVYHRSRATEAQEQGDHATAWAHFELALATATSAGTADELRRSIADLERTAGDREKLAARTLTREIEARLPKRLEPPAPPARPPELRRRRIARAEPPPAAEATAADDRTAAPSSRDSTAPTGEHQSTPAAVGAAAVAKATSSLLNRSLSGPRYLQPEERTPGTATRVVKWLIVPTHAALVALPLAAIFLFAVAVTAYLPWIGRELSLESVPAASESGDQGDSRPAAAPTRPSTSAGTRDTTQGGVMSDADEPTPTCVAGGSASQELAAQIEDQQQTLASLDRQISVIIGQFPNGSLPSDTAMQLKVLRQARDGETDALDTLISQANSASC